MAHAMAGLRALRGSTDPEARVRADKISRELTARLYRIASDMHVRAAIQEIRARWLKRDYDDINAVVREAFRPATVTYVRYVARLEVAGP